MTGQPIIIADRSALFARGVREVLTSRGYEVVGVALTPAEAFALVAENRSAMLLVDESLDPGGDAIERLLEMSTGQPAIVINNSGEADDVVRALASGAAGVVDRSASEEHLFAAIDFVAGGGMVLCIQSKAALQDQLSEMFSLVSERNQHRLALTMREMDVLRLLPSALTLTQIAPRLHISRKTVQNNASSLYRKIGAHGRPEAVARAIALGLIAAQPRRVVSDRR